MYIRFRELLMSWLVLQLPSKHALAMTGSVSQNSLIETSWLSYSGTHTSGWEATDGILADGNAASLNNSATAVSADLEETDSIKLPTKLSAEKFRSSKAKKAFIPASAFRRLGTALGLLFFVVGLLTLGSRRQAPPAPPDLSAGLELSDDERIAEARARLEKVKGLLPAASRLASAVDSAESEKLLAEVQQVIKRSADVEMDRKELENSVTVALKALQKLQQTAIEGAAAIVQAGSSLVNFSLSHPWEKKTLEIVSDLEQGVQQPSVLSFAGMYKSLYANEVCLSQRLAEVAERISAQEKFENETHGERLLTTAIAVEALQDISAWRRHFSSIEEPLSEDVVCAAKFLLLAEWDGAIKDFEGCREYLRVGVALMRDVKEAASEPLDGADKLSLNYLEQNLEILDSNIKQLRDDAEKLKTSTALKDVMAAGREAASLEQQTRELVRQCVSFLESFSGFSADLTANGRKLVTEAARKAHEVMVLGNVGLLLASQDMRETLAQYQKDVSSSGLQQVNAALSKRLTDLGFELETRARQLVRESSWVVSQVGQMEAVDAAMDLLKRLHSAVLFQIHERNIAEALYLNSRLLLFLENDLRATVERVNLMVSKGDRFSGAAKVEYREAERKFRAARKAAAQASTLWEAAEAAAGLRTHALAMQAALFSFKKNEGDI